MSFSLQYFLKLERCGKAAAFAHFSLLAECCAATGLLYSSENGIVSMLVLTTTGCKNKEAEWNQGQEADDETGAICCFASKKLRPKRGFHTQAHNKLLLINTDKQTKNGLGQKADKEPTLSGIALPRSIATTREDLLSR